MADFCKACSIKLFGEDLGELAGITPVEAWKEGRAYGVLCEGCGPIQVDPEGRCVSCNCLCAGEEGHGCYCPYVVEAHCISCGADCSELERCKKDDQT